MQSPDHARAARRREAQPRGVPRIRWIPLLALLLALLAPGRVFAQENGNHFRLDVSEFEAQLPYPPAMVWLAVRQVYDHLGFPVSGASDTTRHVYLTPFLDLQGQLFNRPPGDYFDCPQYVFGAGNINNTAIFTFAVRAEVEAADGGSVLRTQADVRAKRRMWRNSGIQCNSNGAFERRLNLLVRQRLQEMAAAAPRPAAQPQP